MGQDRTAVRHQQQAEIPRISKGQHGVEGCNALDRHTVLAPRALAAFTPVATPERLPWPGIDRGCPAVIGRDVPWQCVIVRHGIPYLPVSSVYAATPNAVIKVSETSLSQFAGDAVCRL